MADSFDAPSTTTLRPPSESPRLASDPFPSDTPDSNKSEDNDTLAGELIAYREAKSGLAEKDVEKGENFEPAGTAPDAMARAMNSTQGGEDPFFVGVQGREELNPHSWGVKYRWAETAFAGMLVLNASKFFSFSPVDMILSKEVVLT